MGNNGQAGGSPGVVGQQRQQHQHQHQQNGSLGAGEGMNGGPVVGSANGVVNGSGVGMGGGIVMPGNFDAGLNAYDEQEWYQ